MQKKEFNLVTGDGTFLIGHFWEPDEYPHAIISLVHGIGEHCGRYDAWARRFCEKGYMVYAVDLRGHGLSEGKRGHIRHLGNYLDDISSLVRRVKHNWSELPHYIYGQSMGGNLVLNFLLKKRQDFAGAIITSPWLKLVHPPKSMLQKTAKALDKVMPRFVFHTGIKSSQLTSILDFQLDCANDSLMHDKISLRLYNQLNNSASELMHLGSRYTIPLFFAHGTNDDITDFYATRDLAEKIGEHATFFAAEGARHELHHEPVSDQLFNYLSLWMEKSMKTLEHAV